ncbi:uncharacterized protein LOC114184525 [Vigna unguiculata]|uniref:uncharacterized protein LOC114184525 n=1 Tax=Vigna unguiculata TaxID=3917 RepID=UPI00101601B5|nr:uncharacterized protein LOC114184525 [Vigna unguiculata]
MAKKLDMIKDIDGKRETLKLGVRVVDHWYVQSRDSTLQLEMILMDENADKIHCIVRREEFDLWDSKLIEGETYIMHNFKILKNEGQYRVCEHPYKLLFIGATSVKLQAIAKLPMKAYNFKSIKDIVSGNFIPDLLIDLIGVVENVRIKPQFKSVESKNVVFTLVDLSGAAICCTLWDEYCKKFIQRYNDVANWEKLVVVITQAKIKPAAGEWPVSVSNTWNGTKLIMESDFPQIVDFKKRMKEYRLQVQVCDDSNNYANFVVWDQECSNIIGLSAADLQKQMIEAGEDDPLCFPDALDVMLGCTFAFKVRTQPRTKCASVIKVSNVSEIVAHVKSLIPPLQIGYGTDKCSMDLVSESSW